MGADSYVELLNFTWHPLYHHLTRCTVINHLLCAVSVCLRDCDLIFIYQLLYAFIGISYELLISYHICLQLTHELRLVTNLPGKSTPLSPMASHEVINTRCLCAFNPPHSLLFYTYYVNSLEHTTRSILSMQLISYCF